MFRTRTPAPTWPDIPAEVLVVQRYGHDRDYVLFDNSADFDDQLPCWDW